jgi:hypothetical protein
MEGDALRYLLANDFHLIPIELLTSPLDLSRLPLRLFSAEQLGSKSSQTIPS